MEEADKVKTEFDFSNKKILIVEDIDSNYTLCMNFLNLQMLISFGLKMALRL